ncbi:hypothetical protein [Thermoanaerobacterium thermosaccharolyticum]|uniref:hypothetical protein n=1 Tax=Thermoanaerobacterium thermosaccharolyticum TaxID=1517 RepID=UPI00177B4932|nr:hypothetical protein [Thermoanaerobacterium thermosaccharolyticum]MBE0069317.1 hypothetical protein [Thermoanaerobacterium thermosaccharolyticum]MBE0229098.1 hypothetical protein [Thermoanaerobacterium thermosaccharolyticum]
MAKTYQDLVKTVHDYIEPLKPCTCGEKVLIMLAIEPVKSDYFKNDSVQHCIVQCKRCGRMYVSEY